MNFNKNNHNGFTLIEIIISIALLGIVSVSILSIFSGSLSFIFDAGRRNSEQFNYQESIENAISYNDLTAGTSKNISINFTGIDDFTVSGRVLTDNNLKVFLPGN